MEQFVYLKDKPIGCSYVISLAAQQIVSRILNLTFRIFMNSLTNQNYPCFFICNMIGI